MSIYNWISLAVIIVGWAAMYGKLVQKITEIDKRQDSLYTDMKALRKWGENEVQRQVCYRDSHYVTSDRFNECVAEIKRRLDEVNTIEINSRLSRIEAMLDQIQITLSERK
jgi:hypothetical protein